MRKYISCPLVRKYLSCPWYVSISHAPWTVLLTTYPSIAEKERHGCRVVCMEPYLGCYYPLSSPKPNVYQPIHSRAAISKILEHKVAQLKGDALVICELMRYTCNPHLSTGEQQNFRVRGNKGFHKLLIHLPLTTLGKSGQPEINRLMNMSRL